ncbi:MAG: bifunctional metallophosphatase/5'-nucleotidase [Immundisolibacter sp.]|uniref:bifunctional metallophosphatase/5'-nucleotidase n=1 Tax=Immundisolibacter sp. TaxID=1934948 RepID=UPI0019CF437F|nr:bifunctional metallophosphatase/5'-nucleotidase [Immundisolibacter sp.]MBC7162111.1 bifunctional metallophosphatase/5'-nucleotidase [Immundisolibacter sp.]
MDRKTATLLLLAGLAAPALQAACTAPSGNVRFGDFDTGVADRTLDASCQTLDGLIRDEDAWGNRAAFLRHVTEVTRAPVQAGALRPLERAKLIAAAPRSQVGAQLTVKLIAFNDFHGNIEAAGSNPGVARLATVINGLRAANPLHAVVSAGDLIGASPLVSALFHDEPTIEAMNRLAIDFNAVGNHEFDEGRAELLRMQNGGNHPTDPNSGLGLTDDLRDGQFAGAGFKFLAANVVDVASGQTLFPGVGVKDFLGNKVAFIGMTLEGTPTIVTPSGVAGLEFRDEADTVNAQIRKLRTQGIQSVVVLIHEGGVTTGGGVNGCDGVSGAIVDIVNRLDGEVDLVVSGHTHAAYNCLIANRDGVSVRVTSAGSFGRLVSDIDLTIDTRRRDVLSVAANNVPIPNNASVAEDPALMPLLANYVALSDGPRKRVIGKITATLTRTSNAAGESSLGDVIADAQLDATDDAGFGDAVVAFMNPGGIRADLPFSAPRKADGDVTYGEAFTTQPFGNSLVTMTLSGAQIHTLLEQQFTGCTVGYPAGAPAAGQPFNRILQVSEGFTYAWREKGTPCDNVDPASIRIDGAPIDPAGSYRVTVNSFLADGGDQIYVLQQGTGRLGGAQDLDALEAYFAARPVGVAPGPQNRIQVAP